MTKEQFQKMWKKWLVDVDKSEAEIARENGMFQQNLNAKIKNGSMKYVELSEIVEKYGYTIEIHTMMTMKSQHITNGKEE